MKKIMMSVLVIAVLSLFIAGCSDNKATTTTITTVQTSATVTSIIVTPIQPTSTTLPPKPLPADVKALVDKANAATSISYKEPDTKDFLYLRGNKGKRVLFKYRGVKDTERYDTVYLDIANKKAYGVCVLSKVTCATSIQNKYREVNYDEFKPGKTPIDFMKMIYEASLNPKMTKIILDTTTVNMPFKDKEGNTGEMWVDTFYGVPYEVTISGETTLFDKIVINRVTDADVNIPNGFVQI